MEGSYEDTGASPNKILVVYLDGSSEVFDNFIVVALRRDESTPGIMEVTMETIVKIPDNLSDPELLALLCSTNDTIVRIVSGGPLKENK